RWSVWHDNHPGNDLTEHDRLLEQVKNHCDQSGCQHDNRQVLEKCNRVRIHGKLQFTGRGCVASTLTKERRLIHVTNLRLCSRPVIRSVSLAKRFQPAGFWTWENSTQKQLPAGG